MPFELFEFHHPWMLLLAVPVASSDTLAALEREVDEIVCLETPHPFYAIGMHYRDFHQIPDDEVVRLLAEAGDFGPASHGAEDRKASRR